RRRLGVALPIGPEGIIAPALVGIGQHLVGLGDLPELLGVFFALGDVRVMLAREPSIGRLDALVVGLPVDAEDLVVVLELDGHGNPYKKCSRRFNPEGDCVPYPRRRGPRRPPPKPPPSDYGANRARNDVRINSRTLRFADKNASHSTSERGLRPRRSRLRRARRPRLRGPAG